MAISERQDAIVADGASPWDRQRMTLMEFLTLPEQKPALEFADGVVTQKVAPTPDHVELQAILRDVLNATANAHRAGRAFVEIQFVHDGVAFVPNVGYYRRERLATRPGGRYARDLGVPDIAIEIVSPDQRISGQIQKCVRYLELGSTIALLVHPEDEAVLAFRAGQAPQVFRGSDPIMVDDVLPGFSLRVDELFQAIVPDWLSEDADAGQPEDVTGSDCTAGD
ncbi:MAG: Uma2 family endonuclease [Chloroflexota bacterium]